MEINSTFFDFFKNGIFPGTNAPFLREFALQNPFEYMLFGVYANRIVTTYWSKEAYFDYLEQAWKGFDPYARKNALKEWQKIMIGNYGDRSNDAISSILDKIDKGLGTLFGGAITIKELKSDSNKAIMVKEMVNIQMNGPAVISWKLYNEVFS
jgi:hypothetical protein